MDPRTQNNPNSYTPPEQIPAPTETPPNEMPSVEPVSPVAPQPAAPAQADLPQSAPGVTQEPLPPSAPVMPMSTMTSSGVSAPQSRKKTFILIGSVVGALIIVVVALFLLLPRGSDSGSSGSSPLGDLINNAITKPAIIDRTDGTLDLSDTTEEIVAQDLSAKLNQQVNLSDGFTFMVTNVRTIDSYKKTNIGKETIVTPAAGKEFVEVSYVVGSRRGHEKMTYSSATFHVYGADGEQEYRPVSFLQSDPLLPENYYTLDIGRGISAGVQESFILYYEVPVGESLYVERSKDYQNLETEERFTVRGRVTLR